MRKPAMMMITRKGSSDLAFETLEARDPARIKHDGADRFCFARVLRAVFAPYPLPYGCVSEASNRAGSSMAISPSRRELRGRSGWTAHAATSC